MAFLKRVARQGLLRGNDAERRREAGMRARVRTLTALIVVVFLGLSAAGETFEAGTHYELLPIPVETRNPDGIEVVEVFSYACVHCFSFEPLLEAWQATQAEDVDFRRVPAVFSPTWELLAKVYFSAEALRVTDTVHYPLFESLHLHGVDLRQPALLARFFRDVGGVDAQRFLSVFDSFSVYSRVQQARAQARMYRITSVPTMIVDGTYRVEMSGDVAGSKMLEVVDFLVDMARKQRSAADEAKAQQDE